MIRATLFIALGCSPLFAQEPSTRPAFDAASIKPAVDTRPAAMQTMQGMPHPADMIQNARPGTIGRKGSTVSMHGYSLLNLISAAYRIKAADVSGPGWLADERYDVDAKLAEGVSPALANEMLQSLLEERFGLKVHREQREVSGYNLLVGKNGPKLTAAASPPGQTADPSSEDRAKANLPGMKQMMSKMAADGAGNRNSGRGMTSAKIAEMISRIAQSPVIDATGLDGRYDVTIETSPDRPDQPGRTIFQAVEELGLKLAPHKIQVDTLVVDKASRKPTGN